MSARRRDRDPCHAPHPPIISLHDRYHARTDHDRLLIIDFGSQVTQLIARRLRELNVFCEIHPFNTVDDASSPTSRPRR